MPEELPETTHFGFTRVGPGESFSKNGHALGDLDQVVKDDLLRALWEHQHDGESRLGNPMVAPGLAVSSSGGGLPPGTTFYYQVAFVDRWGLETATSPEASILTPAAIASPTTPAASVEAAGGTFGPGSLSYAITFITATGSETTASQPVDVTIASGATNRVLLTLPSLPAGATGYRIYRRRPGQTSFYYLDEHTGSTSYYDTNVAEDISITPPKFNTTNSSSKITITIPTGAIPDGVYGWKIYRSVESGVFDGFNLIHHVVEGSTEGSSDLRTTWDDINEALEQGQPKLISSTAPGGRIIDLTQVTGTFPLDTLPRGSRLWTASLAAAPTDAKVISKTRSPDEIKPAKLTAFFQTVPDLDVTNRIRVRITDGTNFVEVICTDDTGYYVAEWPLTDEDSGEAESGTRSSTSTVTILDEPTASNGQAVQLNADDEWIEFDFGVLDAGDYSSFITLARSTNVTNDILFEVRRSDNDAVLANSQTSGAGTTYSEHAGPAFTAPGGVGVKIRVTKQIATANTIKVDKMRYLADITTLDPGDISAIVYVDVTPASVGSDLEVTLWF